jgi:type I restriction enzyme, S subunit
MSGLKPYPAYKDSGVPWLAEVPAHWDVGRSKRMFAASAALARPEDVQLSATQAYGVIPQSEFEERAGRRVVKILKHLDRRRHVDKDDFVMSMRSFQGGLERAWASGAIRSSYVVLKPGPAVNAGFFRYLFKSQGYIRALQATSDFIRDGQDLNLDNFCSVDLPVVPPEEQEAIVQFLDHCDQKIRQYIHAKQKLIALLNEQKQAIIHRAVTRGLDPTVRLKPSGVEWLGDVPEHWDIASLGRLSVARCDGPFGSGLTSSHYAASGVRVVRLQNIGNAEFKTSSAVYVSAAHYESLGDHSVQTDDLLVAGLGDANHPAGRACIAPVGIAPAMVKADCFRFRLRTSRLDPVFASFQLTATSAAASAVLSAGATRQRVNLQATAARALALPPADEQRAIVALLERDTRRYGLAIDAERHELSLLREYRTRLIADVVTGKLDVREAATRLPHDEAAEPEAADASVIGDDDGLSDPADGSAEIDESDES